jgi:hypothetical protein
MINQYEVADIIAEGVPNLNDEMAHMVSCGQANKAIRLLAEFMLSKAEEQNLPMVLQCLSTAEKLYKKGILQIQSQVEETFLPCFSAMMITCKRPAWRYIQGRMPILLYSLYVEKVLKPSLRSGH